MLVACSLLRDCIFAFFIHKLPIPPTERSLLGRSEKEKTGENTEHEEEHSAQTFSAL